MAHWRDLSVYTSFPDNDAPKAVYFEAAGLAPTAVLGSRHVLLMWDNSRGSVFAAQVVQLTGIPGRYSYGADPVANLRDAASKSRNALFALGTFARAQRDRILELAEAGPYDPASLVNGCQVWMRDLLQDMITEGLLKEDVFRRIEALVPLIHRRA